MGFLKELGKVFHAMADISESEGLSEKEKEELKGLEAKTNRNIVPRIEIDHEGAQREAKNDTLIKDEKGTRDGK